MLKKNISVAILLLIFLVVSALFCSCQKTGTPQNSNADKTIINFNIHEGQGFFDKGIFGIDIKKVINAQDSSFYYDAQLIYNFEYQEKIEKFSKREVTFSIKLYDTKHQFLMQKVTSIKLHNNYMSGFLVIDIQPEELPLLSNGIDSIYLSLKADFTSGSKADTNAITPVQAGISFPVEVANHKAVSYKVINGYNYIGKKASIKILEGKGEGNCYRSYLKFNVPESFVRHIEDSISTMENTNVSFIFEVNGYSPEGKHIFNKTENVYGGSNEFEFDLCPAELTYITSHSDSIDLMIETYFESQDRKNHLSPFPNIKLKVPSNIKANPLAINDSSIGFELIQGHEPIKNKVVRVFPRLEGKDVFAIDVDVDLISVAVPKVYQKLGRKVVDADKVSLVLTAYSDGGRKIFQHSSTGDKTNIRERYSIDVGPKDLIRLPPGKQVVTFTLEGNFESFLGTIAKAEVFPLIKFDLLVDVPKIYKTKIHFGSLKLNEKQVDEILGGNDFFSNPAPETGITIVCDGSTVFYHSTRNNYELDQSMSFNIYYTSAPNELKIIVFDEDILSDDHISDTVVSFDTLKSGSYKTLMFNAVDELKIYAGEELNAN